MKIAITRSRVVIAVLSVGLVVSSGAAVWAGSRARTPAQVSAEADAPEPSTVTATVQKGPLASSRTFEGELSREVALAVKAPASNAEGGGGADQIVTFLPCESGDEVRNGWAGAVVAGLVLSVAGAVALSSGASAPAGVLGATGADDPA